MKFGVVLKQFIIEHPNSIFEWYFMESWEITTVLWTALCLDICGLITLKLDILINTKKLYALIPVWKNLTFIQGHSYMRK